MSELALGGRRALITGGGRGIGRAIAFALAAAGADVVLTYRRDEDAAAETAKEIEALGHKASIVQGILDDAASCAAIAPAALEHGPIDIVVHNAGLASRGLDIEHTDPAEIERLWRTHCLGPVILTQGLLPQMREQPRGDVIAISSVATDFMGSNSVPYNIAKAGMEAFALSLAHEERRHGIRVNIVAPGLVDTDMGRRLVRGAMGVEDIRSMDATSPFGRVCRPEDVAQTVAFLVSPAGGYINGQRIAVDGGTF
jgi:3-oxoacyl-[acyl-carrier protein] reductase